MRPRFLPTLVNDRFGDPALYVDFLMERRAMLFDLGDIRALPPKSLLRLSDVFVSHTHIDHFVGFDHLLRVLVGRDRRLRLFGPEGFIDRVEAKLAGYTWNLTDSFNTDLVFVVTELAGADAARRATFRLKGGFRREDARAPPLVGGVLRDEPSLSVACAVLSHRTPCLGFALREKAHVNIWKTRLAEMGLIVGPWLADLKAAVLEDRPAETPIPVARRPAVDGPATLPLGALREAVLSVTPGMTIGYVTDVAHTEANARAIVELVRGADILFIEAVFGERDAARAAERAHLTAAQAGALARAARVERAEPFHFSPRYDGEAQVLRAEFEAAFRG